MDANYKLAIRIKDLCREYGISFYELSYKSAVPMTTLMHIVNASTNNPGVFTIIKICNGFGITIQEFFNHEIFSTIGFDLE